MWLTEGLDRRASPAQGLDGELWRRGGAVLAEDLLQGVSRLLGSSARLLECL